MVGVMKSPISREEWDRLATKAAKERATSPFAHSLADAMKAVEAMPKRPWGEPPENSNADDWVLYLEEVLTGLPEGYSVKDAIPNLACWICEAIETILVKENR